MSLRSLAVFALVLAAGAVIGWFWFGRDTALPLSPVTMGAVSTPVPEALAPPPSRKEISPLDPAAPASKPAGTLQMTSAVMPGLPLVRTTPTPPPPGGVAIPQAGRVPQIEPQSDGKSDLEAVRFMLRDFRTRMGENPVGSNAEIMRAVMGGNEVKAHLGPPAGQSLNAEGELLDRWGTPYFFHQLSKTSMEVRSAGPDGRLWTADDLVTK